MPERSLPRPFSPRHLLRSATVAIAVAVLALSMLAPDAASAATPTVVRNSGIAGWVYSDAAPFGGVPYTPVEIFTPAGEPVLSFLTDQFGHYAVEGLATGSYVARFGQGDTHGFLPQYFQYSSELGVARTLAQADVIVLEASEKTKGKNVYLEKAGTVSGRVTTRTTNKSGDSVVVPVKGLAVTVFNGAAARVSSTVTAADGTYAATGLIAGTYAVKFDPDGASTYSPVWWGGKATQADASRLMLATGGTARNTSVVVKPKPIVTPPPVVKPVPFTATRLPTVSGITRVGFVVRSYVGPWAPLPTVLTTQWLRDGVPITGANAANYTLTQADAGTIISLSATGARDGRITQTLTSAPLRIVTGGVFVAPTPKITGSLTEGSELVAQTGIWSPAPPLTYQWFRSSVPIPGATAPAYTLVAADIGARMVVAVSGTREAYFATTKYSPALVVPRVLTRTPRPVIVGNAKTGNTVTADPFTWEPAPVVLTYAWFRDGELIPSAKTSAYKLVPSDTGRLITVSVTGSRNGYTPVTAISKPRNIR